MPNQAHSKCRRGCARDPFSRDRDETRDACLRDRDVRNFVRDETETRPETHRSETKTRPRR